MIAHPGSVRGTVSASPSKSYTHRALLLGLLANGTTRVRDGLMSEDPRATLAAVETLGATVDRSDIISIMSDGTVRTPDTVIDCLNSGTTLRLVSAIAALAPGTSVLTGDASLRKRPMKPLLDALASLHVRAESTRDNGCAPVLVRGPLAGGRAKLPGDISSQFVSALLLAGARSRDGIEIIIDGELKSEPYVDITIEMLGDFGGAVSRIDGGARRIADDGGDPSAPRRGSAPAIGYRVPGQQSLAARDYRVPGDYSTAAFPLVAGAIAGDVTVENLPERTAQGDKAIVEQLRAFGARVDVTARTVRARHAELRGAHIDLSDTPDAFPALCALAAHAKGETVLSGAAHLRFKESDRIALMVRNLKRLGVDCDEKQDGAIIRGGGKVRGAKGLETEGDHRILMALAVCALRAEGEIELDEADAYKVSYPSFVDDFRRLGQRLEVVP